MAFYENGPQTFSDRWTSRITSRFIAWGIASDEEQAARLLTTITAVICILCIGALVLTVVKLRPQYHTLLKHIEIVDPQHIR